MDTTIISALIASFVSLVSIVITYFTTKQQFKFKLEEIEIEKNKLKNITDEIEKEMTILNQNQLHEILKRRIEVYPYLWEIILVHWQHRKHDEKDKKWCASFIKELKRCHEQYGVYFSQAVYEKYHELFHELTGLHYELSLDNTLINETYITKINTIWYGSNEYGFGLASNLKNDLGSYKIAAIQDFGTK